jgi:hypothetical protein
MPLLLYLYHKISFFSLFCFSRGHNWDIYLQVILTRKIQHATPTSNSTSEQLLSVNVLTYEFNAHYNSMQFPGCFDIMGKINKGKSTPINVSPERTPNGGRLESLSEAPRTKPC